MNIIINTCFIFIFVAVLLAGCEPPAANQFVLEEGFEQGAAKVPTASLSRDYAHSWEQSLKVGPTTEYGQLGRCSWDVLGRPHHLRLRLWARLPDRRQKLVGLVVQVERRRQGAPPDEPPTIIHYQLLNLCEVVTRYRQWVPTTLFVSLPLSLEATDEIVAFMWVPANQTDAGPVYLDDFAIEKLN